MGQELKAVDHKAAAQGMVSTVIDGPQDPRNPGATAYLIGAQVHASLAIAEQLERLNETLAASNLTYADGMVRSA